MKKLYLFVVAAIAAFAVTSCSQAPDEQVSAPKQGKEIKFSAKVDDTRVEGTSFEVGDELSLLAYAQETIPYINNGSFSYDGSYFVGDQTYYWHEDESRETTFIALYPYHDQWGAIDLSSVYMIDVRMDQTTHENYSFSDKMIAWTISTPTEEAVELRFERLNAKLEIKIDNQLGEEVVGLEMGQVYPFAGLMIDPLMEYGFGRPWNLFDGRSNWPDYSLTNGIKAGKILNADNEPVWSLILPMQWATNPTLTMTTESGNRYTFVVDGSIDLESGKKYTATVPLTPDAIVDKDPSEIPITLEWGISGWYDAGELIFVEEGTTPDQPSDEVAPYSAYVHTEPHWDTLVYVWCEETGEEVFGSWPGSDWTPYGEIFNPADGTVVHYSRIDFPAEYEGKELGIIFNNGEGLQTQDYYFVLNHNVYFNVTFDETLTNQYRTEEVDPLSYLPKNEFFENHSWGLVGDFNNWGDDIPFEYYGGDQAAIYNIYLEAGQQFKVRADGAWDISYSTSVEMDDLYAMYSANLDGANCTVPESRYYTVLFATWGGIVWIGLNEGYGEVPPQSDLKIYVHSEGNWDQMFFYAWETAGIDASYPGVEITDNRVVINNKEYFYFDIPAEAVGSEANFVFHNGDVSTTSDITGVVLDRNIYYSIEAEPSYMGQYNAEEVDPWAVESDVWGIVGALNNWMAPDITMHATEVDGLFVAEGVTFDAFSDFKFRTNAMWGTELTSEITGIQPNHWVEAGVGAGNTSVAVAGTYDIYLDIYNYRIYAMEPGVDYTQAEQQTISYTPDSSTYVWGLVGDHNEWGTELDTVLEWDGSKYYVAYAVQLVEGESFKIRANNTWNDAANYGATNGNEVFVVDSFVDLICGGGSQNIYVPATGAYDVYFDLNAQVVWVMSEGKRPTSR